VARQYILGRGRDSEAFYYQCRVAGGVEIGGIDLGITGTSHMQTGIW